MCPTQEIAHLVPSSQTPGLCTFWIATRDYIDPIIRREAPLLLLVFIYIVVYIMNRKRGPFPAHNMKNIKNIRAEYSDDPE